MEDGNFKRSSSPAFLGPSAIHLQVRLTAASSSAMKSSLTASPLAATTSAEAAWMNSVQGQTQLANSKSRRPIIQQSTAGPAVGSPTSASKPETNIFLERFFWKKRTPLLNPPRVFQPRGVPPN